MKSQQKQFQKVLMFCEKLYLAFANFLLNLFNSYHISSKYLLMNAKELSIILIPLTINDIPNRFLGIVYVSQNNMKEDSILMEKIIEYSKNII